MEANKFSKTSMMKILRLKVSVMHMYLYIRKIMWTSQVFFNLIQKLKNLKKTKLFKISFNKKKGIFKYNKI
jgi:hypothetical protein